MISQCTISFHYIIIPTPVKEDCISLFVFLSVHVCVCLSVCLSIPLLWLYVGTYWTDSKWNLVELLKIMSERLYWIFTEISLVVTTLWLHLYVFFICFCKFLRQRSAYVWSVCLIKYYHFTLLYDIPLPIPNRLY